MKRLTFDGLFCDIAKCKETPGGTFCEDGACSQRKVWERLKEYEDTGLEPEQVSELKGFIQGGIHKVDDGWAHVQELLDAEKAGRLVVLPCKVGDVAYKPVNGIDGDGVWAIEIANVYYGWFEDGTIMAHAIGTVLPDCGGTMLDIADFGKTVFLTREEAERALEGGQSDG